MVNWKPDSLHKVSGFGFLLPSVFLLSSTHSSASVAISLN